MRDERRAVVEELEGRRLLSSATLYTSGPARGELIVVGREFKHNRIVVRLVNGGTQFQVVHNGKKQTFARAGVQAIYLFGGEANDKIFVDDPNRRFTFPVQIFGRGGNDRLTGGSGRDSIGGGDGNDLIQGGYGNDNLAGELGDDRVYGGFVTRATNDGHDTLWGESRNDLLGNGSSAGGDDTLVGGSGFDLMYGGAGDDRMYGGFKKDPRNRFGDASDDMFGQDGDDFMDAGSGGRNRMHGMDGTDTLMGGPDNDTLFGGAGADNVVKSGGGKTLGEIDGEWRFLSRFLKKISPLAPEDPGARVK